MDADIQAIRDQFLGQEFDEKRFDIKPDVTSEYARLCGETLPKFIDPNDADFQAPPTFVACLSGGRSLPAGFPRFGLGMDAGKGVECLAPIRPGRPLIGKTHLHGIDTKAGRSGRMIVVVSRLAFYDEDGNHLANSDSRIVMREKSA